MPKGLYIHVPFCLKKCPYCDFYSVTDLDHSEKYVSAVIRNIRSKNISADTVYFGGGTPSLLSAKQIHSILSEVNISENTEITIECNPNTANPKYFEEILSAGINRISFGIQSLNDFELRVLGRIHDSGTAVNAVRSAYKAGFENISADIMIAAAYQTSDSVADTIEKLTKLPIKHISAYMLKIEEGTPYGRNGKIALLLPDEDETAEMYLMAVGKLSEHGFEQYEISNFALDGFESRHNLKYWRCEEYYGIGPSAHSYTDGIRRACPNDLKSFISDEIQKEYITDDKCGDFEEKAMLSLRLTKEGIDLSLLDKEFCDKLTKKAEQLIKAGFMLLNNNRLTLTPKGCLVSNEIISEIVL